MFWVVNFTFNLSEWGRDGSLNARFTDWPQSVIYTTVVCVTKRATSPWFHFAELTQTKYFSTVWPPEPKLWQKSKQIQNEDQKLKFDRPTETLPLNEQTNKQSKWINKYKPQNTFMKMLQKDIPTGFGVNVHQWKMEGMEIKEMGHIQYFRQGNNKDIDRVTLYHF